MPTQAGAGTRERILDTAESLIMEQGFAATSIDQIIEKLKLSKGTFFYHFKTKSDLARTLITRYAEADAKLLNGNLSRAENLSADPLQQILIFVGLFIEMAETLEDPNLGCLFASYAYESGLFDKEIHQVAAAAIIEWRRVITEKLRAAVQRHTPRTEVDIEALADLLTVIFEGAYILSRVLKAPNIFAEQLRQYRSYLQLLFAQENPAAT